MTRGRLVLALGLLALAGSLLVATAFEAVAARRPMEDALVKTGATVERAVATPVPLLTDPAGAPDLALVAPWRGLVDSERRLLEEFVADGGELWLFSEEPLLVAWDGVAVRASPGRVFASDGAPARLVLPGGTEIASTGDLRALDLAGSALEPLIMTTSDAFRDTNGNGRLDAGEPAGPFVAAASAARSDGRVVVAASRDVDAYAALVAKGVIAAGPGTRAVVLYSESAAPLSDLPRLLLSIAALPAAGPYAAAALVALALALLVLATQDKKGATNARHRDEDILAAERARLSESPKPRALTLLGLTRNKGESP